jgi:endonuclease III
MNKPPIKIEALKKVIARFIRQAPARDDAPVEPLPRLIKAFVEYDCDHARSDGAFKKLMDNMVDYNELRVTPAIELAAILGTRYPFAESRCSQLHRTLQSIFDREHHMGLGRLAEMKKPEIRPYLQSLNGISPYVEAAVCVDCYGIVAVPMDNKFLLWLIAKDVVAPETDVKTAQHAIEKQLKAAEAVEFFHGARKELEDWTPKSWPAVAKVPSPVLAPPMPGGPDPVIAEAARKKAEMLPERGKPEPITVKPKRK